MKEYNAQLLNNKHPTMGKNRKHNENGTQKGGFLKS